MEKHPRHCGKTFRWGLDPRGVFCPPAGPEASYLKGEKHLGWLCLNGTNGKDSRVRLRTSSRSIGEDCSKTNLTLILTLTLSLTLRKETKKKKRKEKKRENLLYSNSLTPKLTVPPGDYPTNCAKRQFVTKFLIFLLFIRD